MWCGLHGCTTSHTRLMPQRTEEASHIGALMRLVRIKEVRHLLLQCCKHPCATRRSIRNQSKWSAPPCLPCREALLTAGSCQCAHRVHPKQASASSASSGLRLLAENITSAWLQDNVADG
eukprot:TRINITY_DN7356_c0_g1_i3.p2 TRINITY_DN7356_c0_g1~~TRINITY_DN7356_c0_g1_i3.p2  ORF type:complete len:120 (-),score=7.46 TRINITY_DN7356_c0_g1_i3:718-1077(-)